MHKKGVLHRDFHPGNILRNSKGEWVVTDFGLAKDIDDKYSHQTTTTHAVGRALFTDPVQLFLLKDGDFKTDMYSLAKTIDFVMNQNLNYVIYLLLIHHYYKYSFPLSFQEITEYLI